MKHFFALLFIPLLTLSQCGDNNTTSAHREPHYEEVEDLHIEWDDLFSQNNDKYYVYFYGIGCGYCSALREDMTSLARSGKETIYFMYPSDDVQFTDNLSIAVNSLGATSIEDVYLYSTPTLMKIKNKTITEYIREYNTIRDFIDSYN